MGGPARLVVMLAVAAATPVAAAADRFVPASPDFVVAHVGQPMRDEKLQSLISAWRTDRGLTSGVALAETLVERARDLREPGYFGRAEAVLAPLATGEGANATARRMYAEVLQQRHDFGTAEALIDGVLREIPHDDDARLLRASIRLVRGNFTGARADCAQLAASGGPAAPAGFTCFAESLAGTGNLDRASALLSNMRVISGELPPATQAYLLATRAELHERSGDGARAVEDYRQALALNPRDDSIRAAFADALAATGDKAEAAKILHIEKPSLALLVRRAALTEGFQRHELLARAESWLALEAARGDAPHLREAAMLALAKGDVPNAVTAARQNFAIQKELADVRVLARAAHASHDAAAWSEVRQWMYGTGYRDSVTEKLLDDHDGR